MRHFEHAPSTLVKLLAKGEANAESYELYRLEDGWWSLEARFSPSSRPAALAWIADQGLILVDEPPEAEGPGRA